MSYVQAGRPLTQPSTQTILPVICLPSGQLRGFFAIASTEFDGTEREFTLVDGEPPVKIDINTITLPPVVTSARNGADRAAVNQYMAAVYKDGDEFTRKPWLGYAGFVSVQDTGYYHQWYMPQSVQTEEGGMGTLVGALVKGMDVTIVPNPTTTPDVGVTAAAQRWVASMNRDTVSGDCPFFDFNWVDLFKSKMQTMNPKSSVPQAQSIAIVSNPPGGVFKATIVQAQNFLTENKLLYNTIRILALDQPEVGEYEFQFLIANESSTSVPVTLTLTIV